MTDTTSDPSAEMDRLRAERDQLQREVVQLNRRTERRHWLRRTAVVLLVIVSCVSFIAAVPGVWARRNFLDTERFVDRVAPLINDPAVQEAVSARLTDQLMLVIDPRALFEQVLPERGQLLAVPLANAVEGFVADKVDQFVASDRFAQLWGSAVTVAHGTASKVLRGDSEVVIAEDGHVTLNLLPVIDALLAEITSESPEILGRQVNLPDVSVEDIPASAIEKFESALGLDLGEDFGQFTVYDDGALEAAQQAVRTFDRAVFVLLPLSIITGAAALALSRRRRRTLLQLAAGIALGMVLIRRIAFTVNDDISNLAPRAEGRAAVAVVVDTFLAPLTTFALWALLAAAIVAVIALVTGPYGWAVSLRARVTELWSSAVTATGHKARDEATVAWVTSHRDQLFVAGAAAGLVLLWLANVSWLGLLAIAALVGVFELGVYRIASGPTPKQP